MHDSGRLGSLQMYNAFMTARLSAFLVDLLALLAPSHAFRSSLFLRRVVVAAFYFLAGAGRCAIVVEQ